MNRAAVVLSFIILTGCEVQPIKKVGYEKSFEDGLQSSCVNNVFASFNSESLYNLQIELTKSQDKVTYISLVIDGQNTNDSQAVFTRESYKISKEFLSKVKGQCSY